MVIRNLWTAVFTVVLLTVFKMKTIDAGKAKLSPTFYDSTCPKALSTIRTYVRAAIDREIRMAASLIRLPFHDCFVQGCDASLLLDDAPTIVSEKNAEPNKNSIRGLEVIESAKSKVEKICPGVVSCADIINIAARDASVYVGGPMWIVKLGRRDSRTASFRKSEADLPRFNESLQGLISKFSRKNLSIRDLVVLSGAHTLGKAQCRFFRDRVYSIGEDIDADFARLRRHGCPFNNLDTNLAPLDLETPNSFDNQFFKNLRKKKGLLLTDQVLLNDGRTGRIVDEYIKSPATFESDFAAAMVKLGDIEPLTGKTGEIRRKCSALNR